MTTLWNLIVTDEELAYLETVLRRLSGETARTLESQVHGLRLHIARQRAAEAE